MRSSTPGDGDELDIRRRREGADEERKARRMRRRTAQQSSMSAQGGLRSPDLVSVQEGDQRVDHEEEEKKSDEEGSKGSALPAPMIIVSPTTEDTHDPLGNNEAGEKEGSKEKPVELD